MFSFNDRGQVRPVLFATNTTSSSGLLPPSTPVEATDLSEIAA